MELNKFDDFAICGDTVTGTNGHLTVTLMLDNDPVMNPDFFDRYSDSDKKAFADHKWFFGMLSAKVEVKIGSQSVLLSDVEFARCGVEVNRADNNARLNASAFGLAQNALARGIELLEGIDTAADNIPKLETF
ncbi:hypothetical protein ACT3UM_21400 [Halomonas sp. AOP13-D3-9]